MILTTKKITTKTITKISLLSTVATILMYLDFPLAFLFPEWLRIDLSEVPVLIGAFTMGPVAGIVIELIKNLLILLFKGSMTGGIGELANFIIGSSLVFTAGYIYNTAKTYKRAIIGLIAGIFVMAAVGALANYFVMLPLYDKITGWGLMAIRMELITTAIIPFNLVKGALSALIVIPLYKRVSLYLNK